MDEYCFSSIKCRNYFLPKLLQQENKFLSHIKPYRLCSHTDFVATIDTNYFKIPQCDNKMTELVVIVIPGEFCQEQHEKEIFCDINHKDTKLDLLAASDCGLFMSLT